TRLDELVRREGGTEPVTCTYVVYEPDLEECRIATAGHVPVLAVHPSGRPEVIRPPAGAPLGAGGAEFRTAEFAVPDGSMLVLFTDGLAGGRDLDEGLRPVAELVRGDVPDLEAACDRVVARSAPHRDDVTLLMARLSARPAET